MIKKIILMMIISQMIVGQVFAGTEPLVKAFDELAYSLTVEWDQKDPVTAKQALQTFQARIAEARADGLTDQEIETFYKSILNNAEMSPELREGKLSNDEAVQELTVLVNKAYDQGTSWHPLTYILVGAGSVFVVWGLAILIWEINDKWNYEDDMPVVCCKQ